MRVLEQCTSSTTPEIQQQIHALREAFSRDTSKPFELKLTLGMHSPVMDQHTLVNIAVSQSIQPPVVSQPSSNPGWPLTNNDDPPKPVGTAPGYMQHYDATSATTSMPNPNAVTFNTSSFDIPTSTAYPAQNFSHVTNPAYQQPYSLERVPSNEQQTAPVWDPSGIFSQWNTAFGPQPAPTQPSPPAAQYSQPVATAALRGQQQQPPMPGAGFTPMPTVTPNMWQDAFTSAYVSGHGQKRYRDESVDLTGVYDPYGAKRRG
jgi:hypothetical protein